MLVKQPPRRRVALAAAISAVVAAAGCSGAAPADDFDVARGSSRVLVLLDQDATTASRTIRLQAPTDRWYLRLDCIGEGDVTVSIVGQGSGTTPCRADGDPSGGYVGLTKAADQAVDSFAVRVRAPKGSRWSAAVDVRLLD